MSAYLLVDALKHCEETQFKECAPEYCTAVPAAPKAPDAPKKHKTKYVFVPGCTVYMLLAMSLPTTGMSAGSLTRWAASGRSSREAA